MSTLLCTTDETISSSSYAFASEKIQPLFEKSLFYSEVEEYLKLYPNTQHVDICLHDINGHIRGKRIDINSLKGIAKNCYFPLSVYAMSLDGKVIEETGLGKFIGEPDYPCKPILGTLKPCTITPEFNAQLYLTMQDEQGMSCKYEPRNILKKILDELHFKNYFPAMAAELEFYLFKIDNNFGSDVIDNQCFDLDTSKEYFEILNELEHIAKLQGINVTGVVAESSSGQFEINIMHTQNIMQLCDDIMSLKRIIKQVAKKYGFLASFLAKPNMYKAGSGMHFHMSIYDREKKNIFTSIHNQEISPILLKVISGMISLMPDSMGILAPNVNSFRRFKMGNHVPLEANWGINNRNVAVRIPCSDNDNQRIEYRVPGADCNPYLTVGLILVGALYGMDNQLPIPKHVSTPKVKGENIFLPNNQIEALSLLKNNKIIESYFGQDFIDLWCTVKKTEHQSIYSQITSIEQAWDI